LSIESEPVFSRKPDYQTAINDFACRVLQMPYSEILARSIITKGEEAIENLFFNIRHGEILIPEGALSHPANIGLHGLYVGLNGKFSILTNKSGLLRKPIYMQSLDAQKLSVGLFGHGEISRPDCGKPLRHGKHKVTLDGEIVKEAPEQFRHCNNARCPICFRNYVYHKAFDTSEKLWATRSMLASEGFTPVCYQVVLSPPQPSKDSSCVQKFLTLEGFNDYKRMALYILNEELGSLGGMLVCHPFRENGEDGIKNGEITGNDGDPLHWRFAPHFHALALFDLTVPLQKIAEISARTGWMIKFVSSDPREIREGRISKIEEARDKMNYLLSHAGLIEIEGAGRRMDSIIEYGKATHRYIRRLTLDGKNQPLLQEGHTDITDDGRTLYWLDDLRRLHGENLALCEVERVNASHVFCRAHDFDSCMAILQGLGEHPNVGEIWRAIKDDPRFITHFIPYSDMPRNPRKLQVDGEQLWIFFGDDLEDLYQSSEEYARYCEEAEARDREMFELYGVRS